MRPQRRRHTSWRNRVRLALTPYGAVLGCNRCSTIFLYSKEEEE
jgi:hypothetical protein